LIVLLQLLLLLIIIIITYLAMCDINNIIPVYVSGNHLTFLYIFEGTEMTV